MQKNDDLILVIGATGYVGSRLVQVLLDEGFKVKAASRSMEKLKSRLWSNHPNVSLTQLDLLDSESADKAVEGVQRVFYLLHSMNPKHKDFEEADRRAAQIMVKTGARCGIEQLIYLGGLGESEDNLSKHLRSRAEVASILQKAPFAVTVLRAAMIIGSGSASFEIMRYLVERLPVMITPKWVSTPSQPIAIRNVLNYLVGALGKEEMYNQTFDIGGPDILSYRQLMRIYALEAGIALPKIIPVPVFTPRLSSYWINFVTPVPAFIARPLAEGLRNEAVCKEDRITQIVPQKLLTCQEAIKIAVDKIQHHQVESHWTDAGKMPPFEWVNSSDPNWAGGTVYNDIRQITITGSAEQAWSAVVKIGGTTGWYYANWLWKLRGWLDFFFGGPGLRKGRRHPNELRHGDAIDFWRVRALEPGRRLLLIAEMRLPGQAALEFKIVPIDSNTTKIIQMARFLPTGLAGLAYWYAVTPLHELIFNGMLLGVVKAAGCKLKEEKKPMRLALKDLKALNLS
ncbi:MAG: SDR family oxidoreductase [Candidatus Melainabacteria bacterium]|nr:SDR family oxidoreductase [Candidatus Melainabacteria bacterium]